jgi:hypothetical protein
MRLTYRILAHNWRGVKGVYSTSRLVTLFGFAFGTPAPPTLANPGKDRPRRIGKTRGILHGSVKILAYGKHTPSREDITVRKLYCTVSHFRVLCLS